MAASSNQIEAVRILISLNADIQSKDNNGMTAFQVAACEGNTKIVELFLAQNSVFIN